jgi:type IV pilus assembly protein PilY1
VTYAIGFALDETEPRAPEAKDLLRRATTFGHGKFYTSDNSAGLADAFSNVLNEVLGVTSSFVAPIVPVSRMEKTSAGDKIYLALFRPNQSGMWSGNIKKYGVAQTDDKTKGIALGDILDVSGSEALDSNGEFYPSSKSYWTTSSSDGGQVQAGGVGEILKNRNFTTNPRKIYTFLSQCETAGIKDLTNSCNAFTTTNAYITYTLLGVASTTEKDKLVNFIRGIDSYDDNVNDDTTDKRDWLLGSFLHSRPAIINYADRTVVYAGANDGMLHAFLDSQKVSGTWVESGEELWAYIPGSLLGNLKNLHADNPPIFVDGSPKAYVTYASDGVTVTKAILIFGLRRGGYRYYALDVTDPVTPKFAWHIDGDVIVSGAYPYQEMGKTGSGHLPAQTWSTPVIGKVKVGTTDTWVAFIGGGYDEGQDTANPPADDVGRAVYVVNVLTGSLVKRFSYAEYPTMTYSIPSDIAKLDLDGDGYVERLYVGDMNGQIWRIGSDNPDPASDKTDVTQWKAKIIFHTSPGSSEKRKIFYPPDVTLERQDGVDYEMLFFGTGNRENPDETTDVNRIFAVKDKNSGLVSGWTDLAESDLVDVSADLLQDSSTSQETKTQIMSNLKTKYGWYIKLEKHTGEKCLSSPVVYAKTAYYTTFSPTQGVVTDPCFVGEGTAALYEVKYDTGEAVLNLDGSLDGAINKTDRAVEIGTAIPSGVVVTVIGGKVVAYAGVGGGVEKIKLGNTKSLVPMTWKLVF